MTVLTVRGVDLPAKERLRVRAARHGRSMEAEIRAILTEALARDEEGGPDLATAIRRRFAPLGGVDLPPHPPVKIAPPPDFDPPSDFES